MRWPQEWPWWTGNCSDFIPDGLVTAVAPARRSVHGQPALVLKDTAEFQRDDSIRAPTLSPRTCSQEGDTVKQRLGMQLKGGPVHDY